LTAGRQPVVKIIAESLSQHDGKLSIMRFYETHEELDGPAVSGFDLELLNTSEGLHVKPLVPAAFVVVSTLLSYFIRKVPQQWGHQ
jgi:hypothetical protein